MNDDKPGENVGAREISHGKYLAGGETEILWGWGTPAGKKRAERRGRLIRESAGLKAGVRALEIGCGTGMFTEMFCGTGAFVTALEISPDLIEKANARGLPPDKASFIMSDFFDFTPASPFDAVIGSSVLHHLDIRAAAAKLHGLLRPGGSLCFAEPNMLNPQVFLERKFRRFFPYVSQDETAFVRTALGGIFTRAGFTNVRIVPFDWLHPAIPESLMGLASAAGSLLEKTPLAREFAGSLLISAVKPE